MSHSLLVFINRKLISIDTIIPLLCEIKNDSKNINIKIICPDYATLKAIDDNIFIRDQISNIGSLRLLTLRNTSGKRSLVRIIKVILTLLELLKNSLLGNVSIIHFGLLFKRPFKFITLINKGNVFLAENDSYGFTQLMQDVTFLKKNHKMNDDEIDNNNLIAFSKIWYIAKSRDKKRNKLYYYGTPRRRKYWIDIIKSSNHLEQELIKNNYDKKSPLISIMLGYFGELIYLSSKESVSNSLDETLKVLSKHLTNEIVVLKPHVITDINILKNILQKYSNINFMISYLHPMVLANQSKFAIANYYSSTLSDFNSFGVKTIEYTDYCPETLSLTDGGSMRPDKVDYFINRDPIMLSDTIKYLLGASYKRQYDYNITDNKELFYALNGKKS